MIVIRVPAVPVAQPRQRHRIATAAGGKSFVKNYTPAKAPVNDFKATVRMAAQQAYQGPPLTGPLRVDIVAVFPRPKGLIWKTKAMPRRSHVARPDCDNLAKALLDCLNKVLWHDDAQVSSLSVVKFVASGSEASHVEIRVIQHHASEKESNGQSDIEGVPKDQERA